MKLYKVSLNDYKLFLTIAIYFLALNVKFVTSQCEPQTGLYQFCSCKAGSFLFSLESVLSERTDLTPRFQNVSVVGPRASEDSSKYSYNPCNPFKCSNEPNTAVCQFSTNTLFDAGDQPDVSELKTFYEGDPRNGKLSLVYKTSERKSIIHMLCGSKTDFRPLGETETKVYEFELYTTAACYSSISVGSVLLIIFFSGIFAYLLIGVLYMRFIRGARGIEQIPQLEFWKGLPGAAKDGVVFVMSGCKSDTTYSQI